MLIGIVANAVVTVLETAHWYAQGEHVRTIDGIIDWLRELWKLHEVFAADSVTAKLLAT